MLWVGGPARSLNKLTVKALVWPAVDLEKNCLVLLASDNDQGYKLKISKDKSNRELDGWAFGVELPFGPNKNFTLDAPKARHEADIEYTPGEIKIFFDGIGRLKEIDDNLLVMAS